MDGVSFQLAKWILVLYAVQKHALYECRTVRLVKHTPQSDTVQWIWFDVGFIICMVGGDIRQLPEKLDRFSMLIYFVDRFSMLIYFVDRFSILIYFVALSRLHFSGCYKRSD